MNAVFNRVTYNEQGLAQAGHSLNVQPRTAARFCFVVEDKNYCLALFVMLELLPMLADS